MDHAQALLLALFAALYIYDSALLLYPNEALLVRGRHGRWSARFGSSNVVLRGLELCIPNPLQPTRALYRLAWTYEGRPARALAAWDAQPQRGAVLAPFIWCLFVVSFALLPLALFGNLGDAALLLVFALIYADVLAIIVLLWFQRLSLGLTLREFASMAFNMAICPPFALNLMRQLSLRTPIGEDFALAAQRLLSPEGWASTQAILLARLSAENACEEPGSARSKALLSRHAQLSGQLTPVSSHRQP